MASAKPIKFTRHARNRMRWREIAEFEIESAINKPDFVEPSSAGKMNAWKKGSGKYLRVTYVEETERFLVITAVQKRKGWG